MNTQNKEEFSWKTIDYYHHERTKTWYIIAGVIAFLLFFSSFFTIQHWRLVFLGTSANYLFALILIIATIIMVIHEGQEDNKLNVHIDNEDIIINNKKYLYDEFKKFFIIYKPQENIRNLYFEFKNQLHFRLSIAINEDIDLLELRDFLLKNLDEDLERTEQPLSEQLTKLLKL